MLNPIDIIIRAKDEFSVVMDRARASMAAMEKSAGTLQTGLAGLGGGLGYLALTALPGAGTAFAVFTKQVADYGEQINKASIQTGLSAEQVSGLKYALEQSESSLEKFLIGFRTFAIEQQRINGPQADTFAALLNLVDQFSALESPTERAAFAIRNFNRAGLDLIPFLSNGREGILALMEHARALGIVLDGNAARAADNFHDKLQDLTKSIEGLKTQFIELAPALTTVVQLLTKGVQVAGTLASSQFGGILSAPFGGAGLPPRLPPPGLPANMHELDVERVFGKGMTISKRGDVQSELEMAALIVDADKKAMEEQKKAAEELAAAKERFAQFAFDSGMAYNKRQADEAAKAAREFEEAEEAKQRLLDFNFESGMAFHQRQRQAQREEERAAEELEAAKQRLEEFTFNSAMDHLHRLQQEREKEQRQQQEQINKFREQAGRIFDDLFTRGRTHLESLANILKRIAADISRTFFQDLAQVVVLGSKPQGGGLLGGLAGGIGGKIGGGLLSKLPGLGSIFGGAASSTAGAGAGSIGVLNPATGALVPTGGIAGALGLHGGAGLFGMGAATIPVIGAIAAATTLGLMAIFGGRRHDAPFTTDPTDPRNREYYFYTGSSMLADAARDLSLVTRHLNTVPPGVVVKDGLPVALQGSNSFRRDMTSKLQDDI
jgi:hypothetical protein